MSNLLVQNIKHTNNTTAMTINTSGHVATDTIKGNTSAGSINVVGEGGTNTTDLQQGLAKSWVHSVVSSGTPEKTDSFNTSTITDVTAGDYKPQLTSAMANATFFVSMTPQYSTTGGTGAFFHQYVPASSSTTQYHVQHYQNASKADAVGFSSSILGDLA